MYRRLCGVDGRGGCKNASAVRGGTVFSPVLSEGRTAQGMDCKDLSGKYSHLHKTPVSVVPTSMEGNVKILFLSCKICVD